MAAQMIKTSVKLIPQVAVLCAVYLGGEMAVRLIDAPLPGSVVGMGIMILLLVSGAVPVLWVEEAANLLLKRGLSNVIRPF